ncbi:hypothetical protein ABIA15_006476 [Sinorhizobium fredii]
MPGDPIGIFDVGRDVLEIAAHDPEDERQADQLVDPDEAEIGVREAEPLEILRQRQEHEERRREAEGEQREGDVLRPLELVPRESVGGGHAKQQRHGDGDDRQENRVAEIAHESDVERSGGGLQLAGDQRRVVVERRREDHRWRNPEDRLVRLEGHQENPNDREHEENDDQRQCDATQEPFERRHGFHLALPTPRRGRARAGAANS